MHLWWSTRDVEEVQKKNVRFYVALTIFNNDCDKELAGHFQDQLASAELVHAGAKFVFSLFLWGQPCNDIVQATP